MPLFGRRSASAAPRPATHAETIRAIREVRERAGALFARREYRTAIAAQREAVELAKTISVGAVPANAYAAVVGSLMEQLGRFQEAAGDRDDARTSLRGALRYLKPWTADTGSKGSTVYGSAIMQLAHLLDAPDTRAELIGLCAEATRLATDPRSSDETVLRQVSALHRIAGALHAEGRIDQEIDVRREVIAAVERVPVRTEKVEIAYVGELACMAIVQARAGRFDEAFATVHRCRGVVGEPRSETAGALRRAFAAGCHEFGCALRKAGRSGQSLDWLTVSEEYLAVLYDEEPERYRASRASVWNDWAYALRDLGPDRVEEGLAKLEAALALLGPATPEDSEDVEFVRSAALDTKADLLRDLGRPGEALQFRRLSVEIQRGLLARSPNSTRYAEALAEIERQLAADSWHGV